MLYLSTVILFIQLLRVAYLSNKDIENGDLLDKFIYTMIPFFTLFCMSLERRFN